MLARNGGKRKAKSKNKSKSNRPTQAKRWLPPQQANYGLAGDPGLYGPPARDGALETHIY
jgi:hypothetical protein